MLNFSGNGAAASLDLFEENVRRCGAKAYNFAYRLCGNEQDARDLVQEAFSHALQNIARYDTARPFGPWLNRILRNVYLDGMRRYERKHTVSLDGPSPIEDLPWESLVPGPDRTPADNLDNKEDVSLLQKALSAVPIQYRTPVLLCDIERFSYERISAVLECPIGTVRSRIHHGRQLMKKSFQKLQMFSPVLKP